MILAGWNYTSAKAPRHTKLQCLRLFVDVPLMYAQAHKRSAPVPQNGELHMKFGTYRNVCCGEEIVIAEGMRFPDCSRHKNLTTMWKPVVKENSVGLGQSKPDPERSV